MDPLTVMAQETEVDADMDLLTSPVLRIVQLDKGGIKSCKRGN
jgi:hypothetical protein